MYAMSPTILNSTSCKHLEIYRLTSGTSCRYTNLTRLQINWMTSYRHRVERLAKFSNRLFFHDVINLFHTIRVSYPHRVLNSCRFSVWFARFSARWPSDNMISLLRSRQFATVGKALLLTCYGQFKLSVTSQTSRNFSQLAPMLVRNTDGMKQINRIMKK